MSEHAKIRDWMFRSLMFEADAENFRQAGIRVGADQRNLERHLFDETLAPFPIAARNEALRMSRIYALLHCFENAVRELVKERLEQALGPNWWVTGVSETIRKHAESRKQDAVKHSWLQGERAELLSFIEFGHLGCVVA